MFIRQEKDEGISFKFYHFNCIIMIIGVDLGGTNIRVGSVLQGNITRHFAMPVSAQASQEVVLQEVYHAISQVFSAKCEGIGVGVPSLVDEKEGIVYEVQNIPSWQEIHLKSLLEDKFQVPVKVNNDVNCFVLGEKFFGKGKSCDHLLGIAIGTGVGAGLWLNGSLYTGSNCGAGEIGMMPYLDANFEQYCSGQFFQRVYQTDGQQTFKAAQQGDTTALHRFKEFGSHLGNLMLSVLYAFDPEMIILGGSISSAYPLFQQALWERIHTFAYKSALQHLQLEISELPRGGVLGAAALCFDFRKT